MFQFQEYDTYEPKSSERSAELESHECKIGMKRRMLFIHKLPHDKIFIGIHTYTFSRNETHSEY